MALILPLPFQSWTRESAHIYSCPQVRLSCCRKQTSFLTHTWGQIPFAHNGLESPESKRLVMLNEMTQLV